MIKRLAAVGGSLAVLFGVMTIVSAPADAAVNRTPGCATRTEYRAIYTDDWNDTGMGTSRVASIIGSSGTVTTREYNSDYDTLYKKYRLCGLNGLPKSYNYGYMKVYFYKNYYTGSYSFRAEDKYFSIWGAKSQWKV